MVQQRAQQRAMMRSRNYRVSMKPFLSRIGPIKKS